MTDCSISSNGIMRCVNTLAKIAGDTTPTTTYKVGDTYVKDGVAVGTIVKVDSTGQHGTVAFTGGTASATEANTICNGKSVAGLNWTLATASSACKLLKGNSAIDECAVHTSSGSGWCQSETSLYNFCGDLTRAGSFVCEAPF